LKAKLVNDRRREDEVVSVGDGVRVALAALQRVGESEAAAELPKVLRARALEENRAVVRLREVVVETRAEGVRAQRRRDALDEGREFGGRVGRGGRRLEASARESGRRRQRERVVLKDGDERVCVRA
jgi:hypothetical protein